MGVVLRGSVGEGWPEEVDVVQRGSVGVICLESSKMKDNLFI